MLPTTSSRLRKRVQKLVTGFWFIPFVLITFFAVLAVVLVHVDNAVVLFPSRRGFFLLLLQALGLELYCGRIFCVSPSDVFYPFGGVYSSYVYVISSTTVYSVFITLLS